MSVKVLTETSAEASVEASAEVSVEADAQAFLLLITVEFQFNDRRPQAEAYGLEGKGSTKTMLVFKLYKIKKTIGLPNHYVKSSEN